MKLRSLYALALVAGLGIGTLQARTWTSADGSKTFKGEFKSYDEATEKVTVVMANGKTVTFAIDKLSEEDQTFAKEAKPEAAEAEAGEAGGMSADEFADTELGKGLRKIEILEGKRFKKHEFGTVPEFFILYYSASW